MDKTVETDRVEDTTHCSDVDDYYVIIEHARKLERQRDAANTALGTLKAENVKQAWALTAAEQDAARYRWLRKQPHPEIYWSPVEPYEANDVEIDAALSKGAA